MIKFLSLAVVLVAARANLIDRQQAAALAVARSRPPAFASTYHVAADGHLEPIRPWDQR